MKYASIVITMVGTITPAVLCLPATSFTRQFQLPTCGAETCLTATNGLFNACEPHNLACLCSMEQKGISDYVTLVQPCIDGDAGHDLCTEGAIYQYKDLLTTVCADDYFGNKVVQFTDPE
ncbi:hypothetical protein HBI51_021060 [Parastagonospora nodorum]|nr:hypothetical protein HBI51_021060 [Parastagonospora nodorum]